jgi:SAM-dependent methyltransferase
VKAARSPGTRRILPSCRSEPGAIPVQSKLWPENPLPAVDRAPAGAGRRDGLGRGLAGEVRGYYQLVAPYLDLELADRGDAAFWTWAASEPAGCRVLELGAGTGRATAFLARTAGRVFAFDLFPELVAIARRRLAGLPRVALFVADMRCFSLAATFDLVVAVDDPFAHLLGNRERDLALGAAARHLAPDGRLILDAAWFSPGRRELAARPEGLAVERFRGGGRGQLRVREEVRCGPGRICDSRIEYSREGELLARASFRSRLWSVEEVGRRCRAAGLDLVSLWGGYDRRPWDRQSSSRLIVEARPRKR